MATLHRSNTSPRNAWNDYLSVQRFWSHFYEPIWFCSHSLFFNSAHFKTFTSVFPPSPSEPPTMRWLNVGLHPLIPWCSHDVQNTGTDSPYNLYVEKQSKSNLCKDIAAAECFGRRRNVHSHANSHRKYLLEKTVRVTRKKVNAINVTSRININLLARRNLIPLTFLYIF